MERKTVRRISLHGIFLQAAFWFGFCTYMSFIVTALVDSGWSDGAAAGAMTAMSVIVILAQPIFGYIGDRFLSEKKLSVLLLILAAVCLALLPFSLGSGSKALVLLNMVAVTVTGMQIGGLMDAWIVGLKQEFPEVNYGLIRGSGSLAYGLSAQLMGGVTLAFGHSVRFWLGGGFVLLSVFAALTLRPAKRVHKAGGDTRRIGGAEAFKMVFASKQYRLLVSVSFFLLLSNASMMTLLQFCIRDFGGTTAQIGTAAAASAVSEVPCMFAMAWVLKRVSEKRLLVFASAAYAVRMLITVSVTTANGLIAVQLLQGLTYAVLLPVTMSYLTRIVDARVRTTAVTTYTAITASVTGVLGNLITSGLLASGFSAQNALVVFAVSAVIGCALAVYGAVRKIW